MKTIERLRAEGLSVLLVEQNVQCALDVADRVYVLQSGTVVHAGPASTLRDDAGLRRRLLGV
jgi:branched-chain amino acid transport system ATP-binding protein